MATISDVAKIAGVSTATVSHVINKSRYVSPEIEDKVRQAIEELGYRRDAIASSLRSNRTRTIGLVISDITNPFYSEIYRGMYQEIAAQNNENVVLISNTDEDPKSQEASIEMLLQRRIDGLILAPAGDDGKWLDVVNADGVPTVQIDRYLRNEDADYVVAENRDSAQSLTTHLVDLGHQRIGVLRADIDATTIEDRMSGYQDALAQAQITFDPNLIRISKSNIEVATGVAADMLRAPHPPTAILCTNDFMLLGLFRALSELDLRCPEDIAVVGFDDFPWADAFRPRLTVVSQPTLEIGRLSTRLLLERIKDGVGVRPPQQMVLPSKIMLRESCGRELGVKSSGREPIGQ